MLRRVLQRSALSALLPAAVLGFAAFVCVAFLFFVLPDYFVVASLAIMVCAVAVLAGVLIGVMRRQQGLLRSLTQQQKTLEQALSGIPADYGRTLYAVLLERLSRECANKSSIIVGPWLMEIGFEILYWIPFLRKLLAELEIPPERVIAVSRGGCREWYAGVAGTYVELFELIGADRFVAGVHEIESAQGGKKFVEATSFEKDLATLVAAQQHLQDYGVIFSGAMYGLFRRAWAARLGGRSLKPYLDFAPFDRARFPLPEGFPAATRYVTAKFYFSSCFPDTPEVRSFIHDKLLELAEKTTVVLLNTGKKLDDHGDAALPDHANIIDGTKFYGPNDNLAVQSALVAGSEALYCTYGGFSYLGPLLGVPTMGFYQVPNFSSTHLDLALRYLATPEAALGIAPVLAAQKPKR